MPARLSVAMALVTVTAAAGCGSDGSGSSNASGSSGGGYGSAAGTQVKNSDAARKGQQLRLSADAHGGLRFDRRDLTARPGAVTIVMKNPSTSGMPHAIGIEGRSLDKDGPVAQPGGTSRVSATLKKGSYTFYCPVDGHRSGGMTGTLTVR
jgi:plastocyanin